MAAKKKEFVNCAHCGAGIVPEPAEKGFCVVRTNGGAFYMIRCSCGIITKLCNTKDELKVIWNSKPKKPYIPEKIEVTHPGTRGAKKGDEVLVSNGTKSAVPF